MRELAAKSLGAKDLPSLFARLRTDPRFAYRSREDVVLSATGAIERAKAAIPRWFGRVPRAPLEVRPYPDYLAASNPAARYMTSAASGELRGIYFVNPFDATRRPRSAIESTSFHEGIPGHHLQIALALEASDRPAAVRYLGNSGFVEGWALYAERLADEMKLYSDALQRLGMLSSEAFRAARLVVDSGLHAQGWSRQEAIDFLLQHTSVEPGFAASEVDRYAAIPGQATAYMLGAIEIRRLRSEAERALGAGFEVRAFHDVVLEEGSLPLPMLRERVTRWTASRAPAGPAAATGAAP
jgi:uncharacterized protein (DUF885 family)